MLPSNSDGKKVFKCKCGATNPFKEEKSEAYKLTTNIKHSIRNEVTNLTEVMDWKEEYKRKMVTPEEALSAVKPGDRVHFAYGTEPMALGLALLARAGDLAEKGIKLLVPAPGRDFAWYDPGWENIFQVEIAHVLPLAQPMITERRGDYVIGGLVWSVDPSFREPVDVLLVQLSPPDEHGYCSFGSSLWDKKTAVRSAKTVLAEVNEKLIRTGGDNFIHVSEIDCFVEHTPSGRMPGSTDMLGRTQAGPTEVERAIAENTASLVSDGDTLEIGVGGAAEWLPILGVLEDKNDLGWHSENTPRGIATLVKKGIINGKRKISTGKGPWLPRWAAGPKKR